MSLEDEFQPEFPEPDELDEILQRRNGLNAEIFEFIANQEFQKALVTLEEVAQLDIELEGEVATGTLLKFADVHAGLGDWPKAAQYATLVQEKTERQRAELQAKVERGETLSPAEKMNQGSLSQLVMICTSRIPLYRDYGERLISLRELLKIRLQAAAADPEISIRGNITNLRLKLFLLAVPEPFREPVNRAIESLLAQKAGVISKNDPLYREIMDVVSSYVINYLAEFDPENEHEFIDPMFYEDFYEGMESEEEIKKFGKVNNPLAWEERIKNRAQKIIQKKSAFITEHQGVFSILHDELEKVMSVFYPRQENL